MRKMRVLFLDFKLEIELNTLLDFSFAGNNSEIYSTYGFTEYI